MENISKFLYWTVGILITLAMISAGLILWNNAKPIGAAAQRQAAEQARLMYEAQFAAYDSQLVSGSQLVTAYRRFYSLDAFHLYVEMNSGAIQFGMTPNGDNTACPAIDYHTGKLNGSTMPSCNVTDANITNTSSGHYVAPQRRFRSTLVKDANNRVTGIFFKMH
ncbi:hypothetical protein [Paenibacillus puerhi]|uniref:hypothetical protein n=1 Tax=Paenibacillus puerhi TaxID=2692622 RepID=UPI0013579CF6|nr:hypothetical protein [Paenibacillus puerhi]